MIIYLGDFTHELGLLWLHDLRADKQTAPLRGYRPSYFQADRETQIACGGKQLLLFQRVLLNIR